MSLVIGHVALIQESKKQWFTLSLIKALRDKGYDAISMFAGECREPEYMADLQKKAEDYDLKGYVTFLGRRKDITDLLKMIDVLMIPSAFEGFPLAGLEAGAEEFIRVSGDRACFKENDVEDAARAIETIQKNRDQMTVSGRAFAEKMSNIEYEINQGVILCDCLIRSPER